METMMARVRRLAEARAGRLADALAEAAARELPGDVRVTREGAGIVMAGRGLMRRMLVDPRLRSLAALARALP